jgi:ActR/RegA family two-component response regulator
MPVVHVVDDDASFLVALARLLKASGYAVQTYASAADFLANWVTARGVSSPIYGCREWTDWTSSRHWRAG